MISNEELAMIRAHYLSGNTELWVIPKLLGEIERLQAENEKMAQAIEAWGDADNRNAAADAHDILHKIYEDLPKRGEP